MADVFISYSRKDIAFARILNEMLQAQGLQSWVDWQDILPSADWLAEVYAAIEAADTFVFVVSSTSIASEICSKELAHAIKNRKRLVPIVLQDINPKEVPPAISALNWIFFREGQDDIRNSFDILLKAVQTDLVWVKAHTRLQVRALEWEKRSHNASFLLRGPDLQDAEQNLAQAGDEKDPRSTELQRQYVLASRRAETRRQRTTLGASLGALGIISVCLVIAVILAILAYRSQQSAQREANARATQESIAVDERNIAVARQLASQSALEMPGQFDLSALLAIESSRIQDTVEGRASLAGVLQAHPGLKRYLHPDPAGVTDCLAISPDGKTLLACVDNSTVQQWDVATGKSMGKIIEDPNTWFRTLMFTPDGKRLVSLNVVGDIVVRDTNTWKPLYQILDSDLDPNDSIFSMTLSPDGNYLVTGTGSFGLVMVWDLKTGKKIRSWAGCAGDNEISAIAVAPKHDLVAVGCYENGVHLWKVSNGEKIEAVPPVNVHVDNMSFSSDGALLAYGGRGGLADEWNGLIWIWDVDKNALLETQWSQPLHHSDANTLGILYGLAFSPDGKVLASGFGGTVRLWDPKNAEEMGSPLTGAEFINSMVYSPDGQKIYTGGGSSGLIEWDTGLKGKFRPNFFPPIVDLVDFSDWPSHVAFTSKGGHTLLVDAGCGKMSDTGNNCLQGGATLYDLSTSSHSSWNFPGVFPEVAGLAISGNGKWAATGHMGGEVHLWDISTSEIKGYILGKFTSKVSRLDFSPDEGFLAAVCDGKLIVWDLKQSPPVPINLPIGSADGDIMALHFSSAGGLLVVATDAAFEIFRTSNWTRETGFPFSMPDSQDVFDGVQDFAINPDGKVMAIATKYQLQMVSLPSGGLLASPVRKFEDEIMTVAFSPDGKLLASGGADNTVTLWDAPSLKMIAPMGKYDFPVWSLAFSRDGKYLANLGPTGEIYLWQVQLGVWQQAACEIANRNLSQIEWNYYLPGLTYQDTCSQER